MSTIYGMDVIVTPDMPKRKLAEDVMVTPAFREEINLWMRGFFGITNIIEDGQYIVVQERMVYMNPRTFANFKTQAAALQPSGASL